MEVWLFTQETELVAAVVSLPQVADVERPSVAPVSCYLAAPEHENAWSTVRAHFGFSPSDEQKPAKPSKTYLSMLIAH